MISLLSLPIFYFIANDLFQDEKNALIALFIFATNTIQIKYSIEVKQYAVDVFVLLSIFWLFSIFLKNTNNRKFLLLLIFAGIISIFLSNISIIVLATISVYWFISDIVARKKGHAKYITMLIWPLTFGIYYFFFVADNKNEPYMLDFWQNNFLPINPFQIEFWNFFKSAVRKVFFDFMIFNNEGLSHNLNFIILHIFLIIYIIGLIFIVKKRKLTLLFFLTFPIILHLLLSGLKKYPLDARLALYLSPLVIMTFSYGLFQLYKLSEKTPKIKWPLIMAIIMILSIYPYKLFVNFPIEIDGVRKSIEFINDRFRKDQKVYVYYFTRAPVEYYKKTGRVNFGDAIISGAGEGHVVNWKADLNNLENVHGETWLLFSHLFNRNYPDHPERIIINSLLKRGVIINSFQTINSSAYLFILK
jgi:hypothetical protein